MRVERASAEQASIGSIPREIADNAVVVEVGDTPEALSAIHRPACAAAIWRRRPPRAFQAWIDGMDPRRLPRGRIAPRPDAIQDEILALCERCGTPKAAMRDWLVDDIATLSTHFAGLLDAADLGLRLEAVTSNACSRFHIDAVTARLICTYRGTGTQYCVSTERNAPRRVFTVPTGAPIVLRGSLWPQSQPAGVMHRSPPIEGTGETRLVLVVDPVADPVRGSGQMLKADKEAEI